MKNWLKLIFCMLAIWGFIIVIPKFLSQFSSYSDVIRKSEELGIDNAALFYSEEPLTSIAELELRERLISDHK